MSPSQQMQDAHGEPTPLLAIGLMSGTSADGVDAALVRTNGEADFEFVDAVTLCYESSLRARLLELAQRDLPFAELLGIEQALTDAHIAACQALLQQHKQARIQVIGFHGHTIRHIPAEQLTWQIGDASRLSEAMQCPVVSDFRRRDMAAGGQGAPLAPLFHQQMLATQEKPTVVLNLGGVANITWIGAGDQILAGDTGPGCGLLDEWTHRKTGQPFDTDGRLANRGQVDQASLQRAMSHPFFQQPLPKSADRFQFGFVDVEQLSPEDGAATLCAIAAASVAFAIQQQSPAAKEVWVTGGGSQHPLLMSLLQEYLAQASPDTAPRVRPIEQAGLRSDSLEAECFAWLAVRRLRQLPTSLPETTGCDHATCGGVVTHEARSDSSRVAR